MANISVFGTPSQFFGSDSGSFFWGNIYRKLWSHRDRFLIISGICGAHTTLPPQIPDYFDNFCTNFVVFRSFSGSAGRSPQCHLRFRANLMWHYGERPADSANDLKNDNICQKNYPESVPKTVPKLDGWKCPKTYQSAAYFFTTRAGSRKKGPRGTLRVPLRSLPSPSGYFFIQGVP